MKRKVLMVKEYITSKEWVAYDLRQVGYEVVEVVEQEQVIERLKTEHFDVVLIDETFDKHRDMLINYLKEEQIDSVVMVIAAQLEENDILTMFEDGIDDYMIKPFSSRILIARMHSHLRNREEDPNKVYGDIEINEKRRSVKCQSKELDLTKKEYDVLQYLLSYINQVVSRHQLFKDLWDMEYDGQNRLVDIYIFRLKKHLKGSQLIIHQVHGVGYILETGDGLH